jgi:hypothetical protein
MRKLKDKIEERNYSKPFFMVQKKSEHKKLPAAPYLKNLPVDPISEKIEWAIACTHDSNSPVETENLELAKNARDDDLSNTHPQNFTSASAKPRLGLAGQFLLANLKKSPQRPRSTSKDMSCKYMNSTVQLNLYRNSNDNDKHRGSANSWSGQIFSGQKVPKKVERSRSNNKKRVGAY